MEKRTNSSVSIEPLAGLFYKSLSRLGQFTEVDAAEMPAEYRQLLAHEHHMTVTVEQYHGGPVDVRVLDKHVTQTHYARKIMLVRQSDQVVVQFGIMRFNLSCVGPEVRAEILAEETPLGRILIEHDVHRQVHLLSLWQIAPGKELAEVLGAAKGSVIYGRTAIIDCNGEPGVELLEIVAPVQDLSG